MLRFRSVQSVHFLAQKGDDYYVNDNLIDDGRVYSIATSDTLAIGDSGYPELSAHDYGRPETLRKGAGNTIDSYVCHVIAHSDPKFEGTSCDGTVTKQAFLARADSNWIQPDNRRDLHAIQKTREFVASLVPSESPLAKAREEELEIQNRNLWSFTLQKLDGAFSYNKPNRTDKGVQDQFAGVTNTQVVQAHTEKYSMDDAIRLLRSGGHLNFGFEQQLAFGRSRQGQTNGDPDAVTLTDNHILLSPLVEMHFHRYLPHWKAVLRPIDFSSDLADTRLTLPTAVKTFQYSVNLNKRKNLQHRAGVRFERDALNFFEAGYQHRQDQDVLSQLIFNAGTSTQSVCDLSAEQPVRTCAQNVTPNPNDVAVQHRRTFHQDGLYWTSAVNLPLPVRLTWNFETGGDFFANRGDKREVSTETHYAFSVTNGIKVPIWGNLSLVPRVGLFFFENAVQHATLTRPTYEVQLSYNFDWHQGLRFINVVKAKVP